MLASSREISIRVTPVLSCRQSLPICYACDASVSLSRDMRKVNIQDTSQQCSKEWTIVLSSMPQRAVGAHADW